MTTRRARRRAAILWFVGSAASATAAVLIYAETDEVRWLLLASAGLMAALGWRARRP